MMIYRDVVCQVKGNGQGCSLLQAKPVIFSGVVSLAKGAPAQNITQNTAPWDQQQRFLTAGFERAHDMVQQPRNFFPGQTYASFSPQTEQALNLTEQRALSGSPVQRGANEEMLRTLGGDYLHGGSGFNAAYNAARNQIIPDVESRFARGGRFGSGLAREAETRALGDAFAGQYDKERQRQIQALLFAPQAAQADYADMQALAGVGAQREGQEQSAIDEAMMRHGFDQNKDLQRLQDYMNLIGGNYGAQGGSQTTGFRGNRGAGILGGALGGGGLASLLGTAANPVGAGTLLGGAALGGLLGLL